MNAAAQPTIVAVVNDEPVADPVVQRATELGFERGARVVLYDVGATASPLESPLPTEFASDGPDRGAPPLLTADDLEAAGQAPLARRVRALVGRRHRCLRLAARDRQAGQPHRICPAHRRHGRRDQP